MIDKDGNFIYTPVLKISRKNTNGFSVLTNPVKDFIIINTSDRNLVNTSCSIINMQGVTVKNFFIKEGSQVVTIKSLQTGMYYLRTVKGSTKILIR